MKTLNLPFNREDLCNLKAGDWVNLSGSLLVGRDQAHLRLIKAIEEEKSLPAELNNEAILYAGPVVKDKEVVIGPTTSSRMDGFSEPLFKKGLALTIGKGRRSPEFAQLCQKYKTAYLMTYGGAAAFLSQFVQKAKIIAYGDLGPEALYRIEVLDFPAIIAIDCQGRIFKP